MNKHSSLVRIADDVFVNFYEVASIEPDDDDDTHTLVTLKSGRRIVLANTSPTKVNDCITKFLRYGDREAERHKVRGYDDNCDYD